MPSTRYTVRLPPALDAAVQARVRQGTPFAVLIREALAAYLADTPPTDAPTAADSADTLTDIQTQLAALTTRVEILEQHQATLLLERRQEADRTADSDADRVLTSADSADTLRALQEQLAAVIARVEVLELALTTVPTPRRQEADRPADTPPTGADIPRRPGRPSGPLRQQILDVLTAHPEGLRAEEIRVYVATQRPIGDTLAGMVKGGVIRTQGRGPQRRYVRTD